VLEIQCHGGVAVTRAIEERALAAGLRRARAGEFTARAVSNGKMDLLDAEALAALLCADDEQGLSAARGLRSAATSVRDLRRRMRAALAQARGLLDYPVETAAAPEAWRAIARALHEEISALVEKGAVDGVVRDGLTVAILGPPNAGKSSILNILAHEVRALVDAEPGTTRDALYAPLLLNGRRVTLIDTAGLRTATGWARL
jgi:tRNA modification GTPase